MAIDSPATETGTAPPSRQAKPIAGAPTAWWSTTFRRSHRNSAGPLRVMALPAFQNRANNPYHALLYEAMQRRGTTVDEVSPRRVLRARHDVVHLHWPE